MNEYCKVVTGLCAVIEAKWSGMKLHTVFWRGRHICNKIHSFFSQALCLAQYIAACVYLHETVKQCLACRDIFLTQLVRKCLALLGWNLNMCRRVVKCLLAVLSPKYSSNSPILILYSAFGKLLCTNTRCSLIERIVVSKNWIKQYTLYRYCTSTAV
jgi:ribosomal protein L40E